MPLANSKMTSVFLEEISKRYPDKFMLMFGDGASWHVSKSLLVPENIVLLTLSPRSPQLNPTENIWHELREKWFYNLYFDFLDALEGRLIEAVNSIENDNYLFMSITSFNWIGSFI